MFLKNWIRCILCVLVLTATCLLLVESATKSEVLDYLQSIRGKQTISGQHNKEPISDPARSTKYVQRVTRQTPGLWGSDFLFSEDDIRNRQTMINEGIRQWKAGSLISLTFNVCPPTTGEVCTFQGTPTSVESKLSPAQWDSLLDENGGQLNKAWKSRLDTYVPFLQQLKSAGAVPILRPFQEINGNWFWWGARKQQSARLFQITRDYLTSKGLDNLIWSWTVHNGPWLDEQQGTWEEHYPGDAYVDVLALDVYNDTGRTQPDNDQYMRLLKMAGSKPIALGEVGQLPDENTLKHQTWWVYFMGWADEYIMNSTWNTPDSIRRTYRVQTVLKQGQLRRFS